MVKEQLKKENIADDMNRTVKIYESTASNRRINYIAPFFMLAIILGIVFKSIVLGIVIFIIPAYHIIWLIIETRESYILRKELKENITRGDLAISVEKLTHIDTESVYNPHNANDSGIISNLDDVSVFYFESGACWRVPLIHGKHYEWSKTFKLSQSGLYNTSVVGDEFYYIILQNDQRISYIYNKKLFELSDELKALPTCDENHNEAVKH